MPARRIFAVLARYVSTTSGSLPSSASHVPLEEELFRHYNPKAYYPVNPGDVFHDSYKTVVKLGFGSHSTVWLAKDLRKEPNEYVAVKFKNCDYADEESSEHELNISHHIATANPSCIGFGVIRTVEDTFEAETPYGKHKCLVYSLMREPLCMFRQRFMNGRLPLPILKAHLKILLMGLSYLHSTCGVVHTDLKLDNILVTFEDPSVLLKFIKRHANKHQPRKVGQVRTVYQSSDDFGDLRSLRVMPMIADLGLAQWGHITQDRITPIQADWYRAPEVILGAGWTYSTDIWNLALLVRIISRNACIPPYMSPYLMFAKHVFELLENKRLFANVHSSDGKYNARTHLAEMIASLGAPPAKLLRRELEGPGFKWVSGQENDDGVICDTAVDFFGGPFFDSKGQFMYPDLIPNRPNLEASITSLDGEEKQLLLSFMRKMLTWWPKDRNAAGDLVKDPWLNS